MTLPGGLLDDHAGKNAADFAKAIIFITSETKNATVGDDKKYQLVFSAPYAAGNVQSQLKSGLVRSDRHACLLTLFAA